MIVVEPVFTAHALGHKIKLNGFVVLVRCQIAVTVDIVKSLVVLVVAVFVVFLLLQLTTKRKLGISTVTSKGSLAIKFKHFMSFMAY